MEQQTTHEADRIEASNDLSDEELLRRYIAEQDQVYGIENFDAEQPIQSYYIQRNNGGPIQSWLLIGESPETQETSRQTGKFFYNDPVKGPAYKYLDMNQVISSQHQLRQEYEEARIPAKESEFDQELLRHAKAVTDLGVEAVEDAPVIGPNDAFESIDNGKYEYLRDLLPPTLRPAEAEPFAYLFAWNKTAPQLQHAPRSGESAGKTEDDKKREYYDRFVTEENRQDALVTLQEAAEKTTQLREILRRHGISTETIDAVDAIREDPEVRFEVAKVLAEKLDRLVSVPNDMGRRINENSRNNLKADPITGRKMLSRTYAIDMALKMLGGEFSTRTEGDDPIERDDNGRVKIGQHRHAATATLMSY